MIGYIKGNLISAKNGIVILETGGIGYEITCSNQAFSSLINKETNHVFTYMAVKEDGVFLYGFINEEEKNMFLKLITVSGVGPKMGITILSNMDLKGIAQAIALSDVKALSSIKGLGKKTAERIILELREKMSDEYDSDGTVPVKTQASPFEEDAIIALMSLGFNKSECQRAIEQAKSQGASDLQALIAIALKTIK